MQSRNAFEILPSYDGHFIELLAVQLQSYVQFRILCLDFYINLCRAIEYIRDDQSVVALFQSHKFKSAVDVCNRS